MSVGNYLSRRGEVSQEAPQTGAAVSTAQAPPGPAEIALSLPLLLLVHDPFIAHFQSLLHDIFPKRVLRKNKEGQAAESSVPWIPGSVFHEPACR